MQHRHILLRQRNGVASGRQQAARPQFQHPGRGRRRDGSPGRFAQAPRQRAQGGRQFIQVGALGQVIVGAAAQAVHLVPRRAACRKHDDADGLTLRPQGAHQQHAVAIGQAQVDDGDAVQRRCVTGVKRGQVGDGGHAITGVAEEFGQFLPQHGFVFKQNEIQHGARITDRHAAGKQAAGASCPAW